MYWFHSPVLSKKPPSRRADLCRPRELELLVWASELGRSRVLSDRVSNPFRLSSGRECEAWQSPALSLWSSPLSFKLLQMCVKSGHGVGPGWDGRLAGCRELNLPFTNSLMNATCLRLVSLQSEFEQIQQQWRQNKDSQRLLGISKTDMAEFGCEDIWAICFFVVQRAGSQVSYQPWCCLGFCPDAFQKVGGSDEECNFTWLNFPLRSLMSECHTWLPSSKPVEDVGKCNISLIRQVVAATVPKRY